MAEYYYKKQPSCTTPDGREWFASGGGKRAPEYIDREAAMGKCGWYNTVDGKSVCAVRKDELASIPAADVVPVVHGCHAGDVCIYGFGHENKSRAIVEIVRILNDERGVAEVKFHKVFADDTGNGFFNYLLKSGNTMNASFKYLKNITPRMDGE